MKKSFLLVTMMLFSQLATAGDRPSIAWSVAFNTGTSSDEMRAVQFSDNEPGIVYFAGSTAAATDAGVGPVADLPRRLPYTRLIPEDLSTTTLFSGSGLFVGKMNYLTNEIIFLTFLPIRPGGTPGISDMAIAETGEIYLIGSINHYQDPNQGVYLPLRDPMPGCAAWAPMNPPNDDGIFIKLNADASEIISSCFFGGSADDRVFSITTLPDGKYILVGDTRSDDLFTINAPQASRAGSTDGFYSIYEADGTPVVSSYFGGSDIDGLAQAVTSDSGRLLVAGATRSPDLPVSAGAYQRALNGGFDALIMELDPSTGGVIRSSYLGGSGNDSALGITTDRSDNAYVVGTTASTDFPARGSGSQAPTDQIGAFFAKLNLSLSDLAFATVRSSTNADYISGEAIAVNGQGDVVIVGQVARADWYDSSNPLVELDDPDFRPSVFEDGHVIKWLSRGNGYELDYASLLGGRGGGQAVDLRGREEVLIGGYVSGNPYLDPTYHHSDIDGQGASYGAFAMVVENTVQDSTAGGGGSTGGSGGGGAVSPIMVVSGLLTVLLLCAPRRDQRKAPALLVQKKKSG